MKRLLTAAALLIAAALLTACGAVQVNDRMFVQLMGIEEDNGIYLLTVQTYNSSGTDSEESAPRFEVRSGSGRSFYEAADMIMRETGRELFFGHCSAIFADDELIRRSEKLSVLSGERISIACPVIYADNPSEEAQATDGDELIGADRILSELELYKKEGLYRETSISELVSASKRGDTVIIPRFDGGLAGAAAVDMGGSTSLLDMTETAALNLLRGEKGVRLSVLGGSASLGAAEKSVYFERSGDNEGVYNITLAADCTLDERGAAEDMSVYRSEIEGAVSRSAEAVCDRAFSEGFLGAVLPEGYEYSEGVGKVSFNVTAEVDLHADKG